MLVGKRNLTKYEQVMRYVYWGIDMLRDGFPLVDVREYFASKMTPAEFKVWKYQFETRRKEENL